MVEIAGTVVVFCSEETWGRSGAVDLGDEWGEELTAEEGASWCNLGGGSGLVRMGVKEM